MATADTLKHIPLHFAPMQGYADHVYRKHHAEVYGGVDKYYTPFIRVEKGEARHQDISKLKASADEGQFPTPQIIFGSFEEFEILRDSLKPLGVRRVDLNLGCPFPMQTNRGRGAAMIANVEVMEQVAQAIQQDADVQYSVKMRLGLKNADEWKVLLPILNAMPLTHITVHPRIASQLYEGELFADQFVEILNNSVHPVIWNGDVKTVEDISHIQSSFPGICGIMIGRGLLARPSLAMEWKQGKELTFEERMALIKKFHQKMFDSYSSTLCGDTQILQKLRTFWEYLEPEIGRKAFKAIKKATSIAKYRTAIDF